MKPDTRGENRAGSLVTRIGQRHQTESSASLAIATSGSSNDNRDGEDKANALQIGSNRVRLYSLTDTNTEFGLLLQVFGTTTYLFIVTNSMILRHVDPKKFSKVRSTI